MQFFRYCTGKLLEGSGGLRKGTEVHKWVHHDPRASMGYGEVPWPYLARRTKSSKAIVAREGKKGRSPSRNRIGVGFQVLLPLGCTLDFGGAVATPLHLYIEGRGLPKRTHKALGAPLSPVTP